MKKKEAKGDQSNQSEGKTYRLNLPGFISDEAVGLGDVIKRVTYVIGIKPCGGCERRAARLNRVNLINQMEVYHEHARI